MQQMPKGQHLSVLAPVDARISATRLECWLTSLRQPAQTFRATSPPSTVRERRRIRGSTDQIQLCMGMLLYLGFCSADTGLTLPGLDQIDRPR